MHRTATHVFMTIALLVAYCGPATAQTPLISVEPDSLYTAHGATFTLSVRVSAQTTSLMGYNILVTFDPSVLQLQGVAEGSLPLDSGYETFFFRLDPMSVGSVHVNGAILGNTVNGPGALFTLTFKAWSPNQVRMTDVVIASSEIRDGINRGIAHSVQNGFVVIEPPIAVQPVTWGAVKAHYR